MLGRSQAEGMLVKCAHMASARNWQSDRPCWADVAAAVRIRSRRFRPSSPRVFSMIRRLITTNRIARSAAQFVD